MFPPVVFAGIAEQMTMEGKIRGDKWREDPTRQILAAIIGHRLYGVMRNERQVDEIDARPFLPRRD